MRWVFLVHKGRRFMTGTLLDTLTWFYGMYFEEHVIP